VESVDLERESLVMADQIRTGSRDYGVPETLLQCPGDRRGRLRIARGTRDSGGPMSGSRLNGRCLESGLADTLATGGGRNGRQL